MSGEPFTGMAIEAIERGLTNLQVVTADIWNAEIAEENGRRGIGDLSVPLHKLSDLCVLFFQKLWAGDKASKR